MKLGDINTTADVIRWLRSHVEWNDEHSKDMANRACVVLRASMPPACAPPPISEPK